MTRALLVALALLAPLAAAAAVDPPSSGGACVEVGCARFDDLDGDGVPEWFALSASLLHQATLNVVANNTTATYEAFAGTEEAVEPFHGAYLVGYADANPGLNETWTYVLVYEGDEETGETTPHLVATLFTRDHDGDGRPNEARAYAALP